MAKKFNGYFEKMLGKYDRTLSNVAAEAGGHGARTCRSFAAVSLRCIRCLGVSFFPRTDPGTVRDQPESADGHAR